jgi:hypothetical protein
MSCLRYVDRGSFRQASLPASCVLQPCGAPSFSSACHITAGNSNALHTERSGLTHIVQSASGYSPRYKGCTLCSSSGGGRISTRIINAFMSRSYRDPNAAFATHHIIIPPNALNAAQIAINAVLENSKPAYTCLQSLAGTSACETLLQSFMLAKKPSSANSSSYCLSSQSSPRSSSQPFFPFSLTSPV